MPFTKHLLHSCPEEEKRKHKKKNLVQSPNSYFMDVNYAQTVVLSVSCSTVLSQPTGGKARLTEGCSFRGSSTEKHLIRDEWEQSQQTHLDIYKYIY
ncbi:40S ribosomal protein S27 [Lemmus lemmus]